MKWLTLFKKANRINKIRRFTDEFDLDGFIGFAELMEYLNPPLSYTPERLHNVPFDPVVGRASELIELFEISMGQMKEGKSPAVKPAVVNCSDLLTWLDTGDGRHYDLKETIKVIVNVAREYQDAIDAYREDKLDTSILRSVHYLLVCLQQLVVKVAELEYGMEFHEEAR